MKVQQTNLAVLLGATLILAICLIVAAGCGHESVASQNSVARRPAPVAQKPAAKKPTLAPAPIQQVQPVAAPVAAREPVKRNKPVKGKAPPADRTPDKPGGPEKIAFEDLNLQMREDMVYRPFLLTERAKELDGQRVSIVGFIHGGASGKVEKFVLLKNTECKFGPGGQADHLAMVYLAAGETTQYTSAALKVEGTLNVEPFTGPDGNTWSVYRIDEAKVDAVR
ncbi:MAG: hypothetical protein WD872_00925 [Pirellulaceae bacterium]